MNSKMTSERDITYRIFTHPPLKMIHEGMLNKDEAFLMQKLLENVYEVFPNEFIDKIEKFEYEVYMIEKEGKLLHFIYPENYLSKEKLE